MLQSSDSDLYIADGIHRHSWVFAEGNNNNYSTIIVNRTNRELRKRNSAIVNCIKKTEKNNACDFAFILIHPEFERFSKVIDMLYYDAAYVNNFELKSLTCGHLPISAKIVFISIGFCLSGAEITNEPFACERIIA